MTVDAGLLLVDKPAGDTSHDVVLRVRRALGIRRVGHTGTLDPFATGLLLVLVGRFTRLAELYHVLPKSYEATLELGRETETDDLTGESVAQSDAWKDVSPESVCEVMSAREGEGEQVPPTYSAVQVDGRRAYDIARGGRPVELAARPVTFHELRVIDVEPPCVRFRAVVSTGTYIRALARDLGRDLGCGAHLTQLRRVSIGPFEVSDAIAPDAPRSATGTDAWRLGGEALPWLPRRRLSEGERDDVCLGRPVSRGELDPPSWSGSSRAAAVDGPVALTARQELVAVADLRGETLHPKKVFGA